MIPISMFVPFLLAQQDLFTLLWSDSEIIPEVLFQLQAQNLHTWILLQLLSSSVSLKEFVLNS